MVKKKIFLMPEVGFEPTPTNRIELKSTALDHSAIQALLMLRYNERMTRQQRDSNPRG